MNQFWEYSPVFVIFPTFALVIKWYLEYRLKQRLIEKGIVDEKVKYLNFNQMEQYAPSSLKWGLVSLFLGLGIIITTSFTYLEGETILGIMLVSAGLGLLVYYGIANTLRKKHLEEFGGSMGNDRVNRG